MATSGATQTEIAPEHKSAKPDSASNTTNDTKAVTDDDAKQPLDTAAPRSAGHNEFNLDISSATKQIASYGVHLFREGIERTKQMMLAEHSAYAHSADISGDYEMIDNSLSRLIPEDTTHADGQQLLMRSDLRLRDRVLVLLIRIGIELPIRDWSWFDLFLTGLLKCGTIKIINYIDRDLIGKVLLGLCWVIPPFIHVCTCTRDAPFANFIRFCVICFIEQHFPLFFFQHFFDANVERFVSKLVIQLHASCCLLMVVYGVYDVLTSFSKYDWKKSLLFSSILMALSTAYYLLFY